jgi:hypothetical protein
MVYCMPSRLPWALRAINAPVPAPIAVLRILLDVLRFLDVVASPTTPPMAAPRPAADCRLTAWAATTTPVWTLMDCPERCAEANPAKSSEVTVTAIGIIILLIRMFIVKVPNEVLK